MSFLDDDFLFYEFINIRLLVHICKKVKLLFELPYLGAIREDQIAKFYRTSWYELVEVLAILFSVIWVFLTPLLQVIPEVFFGKRCNYIILCTTDGLCTSSSLRLVSWPKQSTSTTIDVVHWLASRSNTATGRNVLWQFFVALAHAVGLERSPAPQPGLFFSVEVFRYGVEGLEHALHCPSAEDGSVVDREVGREHAPLGREEFDQLDGFGDHYVPLLPLGVGAPEERYLHVDSRHCSESPHSVPVLLRIDLLDSLGESAMVDDHHEIRHSVENIGSLLVLMRVEHELEGSTCLFHHLKVVLDCLLKEAV